MADRRTPGTVSVHLMRAWILSAALAAAVLGGLPTSALAAATPTATPKPQPSPTQTSGASAGSGAGTIHGWAFADANADGQFADGEAGLGQVSVKLTSANGLSRTALTDDTGAFAFDAVAPGQYRVSLTVPSNYVATT